MQTERGAGGREQGGLIWALTLSEKGDTGAWERRWPVTQLTFPKDHFAVHSQIPCRRRTQ